MYIDETSPLGFPTALLAWIDSEHQRHFLHFTPTTLSLQKNPQEMWHDFPSSQPFEKFQVKLGATHDAQIVDSSSSAFSAVSAGCSSSSDLWNPSWSVCSTVWKFQSVAQDNRDTTSILKLSYRIEKSHWFFRDFSILGYNFDIFHPNQFWDAQPSHLPGHKGWHFAQALAQRIVSARPQHILTIVFLYIGSKKKNNK